MVLYWCTWRKIFCSAIINPAVLPRYKKQVAELHKQGATILSYLACGNIGIGNRTDRSFSLEKINDGKWIYKSPVFDAFWKEWAINPIKINRLSTKEKGKDIVTCSMYCSQLSKSFNNYMASLVQQHIDVGSDGIGIFDGASLKDSNQLHGAGYYDEKGIYRPTYTNMGVSRMCKQLLWQYSQSKSKQRRRITGLGLEHTHGGSGKVVYGGFFDAGLKGEETNSGYYMSSPKYRKLISKDKYYYANLLSLKEFRIEYTGRQFGWAPVFFSQLKKNPGVSKEWANSPEGARISWY